MDQIDAEGFRANVGIVICDQQDRLLIGGRVGKDAWQFPQGGIRVGESPEEALYRELHEETGLAPGDVRLLAATAGWLSYRLPEQYIRRNVRPLCIGQKQRWFLLRLLVDDSRLRPDTTSAPEFDRWRWVGFWEPVDAVIHFKREVYVQALTELGSSLFPGGLPPRNGQSAPRVSRRHG